jgi:hypothetical protein
MFRNLLSRVGLGTAAPASSMGARTVPDHAPYTEAHVNFLYNLLFCDNLELFRNAGMSGERAGALEEPWLTLLALEPSEAALRRLADGWSDESRVRALAFNRLREIGAAVAPKILLGVIVEVPLRQGLDVLAAYADGRVRYLNHAGKVSVFEGGPIVVETLARELVVAALPLVQRIGTWERVRLPPPRGGRMRITFLTSDGVCFGEGTYEELRKDPLGRAVLGKAIELLDAVVDAAVNAR